MYTRVGYCTPLLLWLCACLLLSTFPWLYIVLLGLLWEEEKERERERESLLLSRLPCASSQVAVVQSFNTAPTLSPVSSCSFLTESRFCSSILLLFIIKKRLYCTVLCVLLAFIHCGISRNQLLIWSTIPRPLFTIPFQSCSFACSALIPLCVSVCLSVCCCVLSTAFISVANYSPFRVSPFPFFSFIFIYYYLVFFF